MAVKRKKYKSRREKFERNTRNIKLILIFGSIALAITIFRYRWAIYDWVMFNFIDG